jgi:hypothetical protein
MGNRYLVEGSQEVIFTLYENSSNIVDPQYRFELENKDSLVVTTFYQEDHSPAPPYYNSFTVSVYGLTESGLTESGLTQGIIFANIGQYNYRVIEIGTDGLVENGIMYIGYTSSTTSTFTASNTIPTYLGGI